MRSNISSQIFRKGEAGAALKEICRKHNISDSTFYTWSKKYRGMDTEGLRRLKLLTLADTSRVSAASFTNRKGCRNRVLSDEEKAKNRTKSKVRAIGEHPFLILKRIFSFNKVRYRRLDENADRLFVACGLVNLFTARKVLLRPT